MAGGRRRGLREFSIRAGEYLMHSFAGSVLHMCQEWAIGKGANWFSSMISYPNYKYIFPIMALGKYAKLYGNGEVS